MKHMKLFLPLAVVALALMSCARQPDTEGFRKTVDEMNAASIESMTSGNTDKVLTFYADDAVSMPPNMEPLKGKAAIEQWMKQMNQSGMKVTSCNFSTSAYGVDGSVAYETGTYAMTVEIPGMGVMNDKGNFVSIWKQQADHSWKLSVETWASSLPPPPTETK